MSDNTRLQRIAERMTTASQNVEVELYFVGQDEAEAFSADFPSARLKVRGQRVTGEIPADKVGEAVKSLQNDYDVFPALTNE